MKIRSRPLARGRNGGVRRIIGLVVDVSQDHSTSEALQATSRRLVNAEESERRRIGRELHDSTIQHLVAIDLLLGGLEQRPELREDHFVLEMRETLGSVQREIRTFAFLLHPPNIDEQGLEQTLRRFCAGFARRTGLTIELDMRLGGARLSFDAEVALFRIAQEALMNIHRHAQATMVALHLKASPREVVLVVADDGVGMSSAE
ncbi:MAG: sensor histidine kinase, partial [Brevundimonas sp.]